MDNSFIEQEVVKLQKQVAMLEKMIERERALPKLYATAQESIGLSAFEYKIIMTIRRVLRVRIIKRSARIILSALRQ